jgi:hypothetical protein
VKKLVTFRLLAADSSRVCEMIVAILRLEIFFIFVQIYSNTEAKLQISEVMVSTSIPIIWQHFQHILPAGDAIIFPDNNIVREFANCRYKRLDMNS